MTGLIKTSLLTCGGILNLAERMFNIVLGRPLWKPGNWHRSGRMIQPRKLEAEIHLADFLFLSSLFVAHTLHCLEITPGAVLSTHSWWCLGARAVLGSQTGACECSGVRCSPPNSLPDLLFLYF